MAPLPFQGILDALTHRVQFEAAYAKEESPSRLRIMGRLPKPVTPQRQEGWKSILLALLCDDPAWTVDISYHCFKQKEPVETLLQMPRFIFQSRGEGAKGLQGQYPRIAQLIRSVQVPEQSISVPLNPYRNDPAANNGKGAQSSLSAVVGPAAFARHRVGG